MHLNTESRQPCTRGPRRVATLALAAAAAGVMLLPVGQGVAGASSTATTGISYSSYEKPPLHCGWGDRYCNYGWWGNRWWGPSHPGWGHGHHHGNYHGNYHGNDPGHHYGDNVSWRR
ncbi:hypothetical protein [Nonomuraea basaltis]|uniref:hypothetical protein n=1 Tax=Nonomuraea basaltis TaxID=2495887 RepID=UPI001485E292|nr:hypothetical protein [Nonomuraea basaltis]